MAELRPHPFAPIVRWLLFPVVAGLAAAAGAAAAFVLSEPKHLPEALVLGALLGIGAGAAVSVSARPWVGLVVVPVVGVLILCGGFSAYETLTKGQGRDAWSLFLELIRDWRPALWFLLTALAQAAGHYAVLAGRADGLRARALAYGGLGLLVAVVCFATLAPDEGTQGRLVMAAFTFFSVLAQVPSVPLARKLSARLRPS